MSARAPLTDDELDALLNGRDIIAKAPRRPSTPAKATARRYDRCDRCNSMQPALITFSGQTDWEPQIPRDDPIRAQINALRDATGSRKILLCTNCLTTLRSTPSPNPVEESTTQLTLGI